MLIYTLESSFWDRVEDRSQETPGRVNVMVQVLLRDINSCCEAVENTGLRGGGS